MIHSTAIIHETAQIDASVEIGPYAVVGEGVTIGAGTKVGPHAVIDAWTEIGKNNTIFQFASVGAPPQDLKFAGEQTWLRMGDNNHVREFATLHRGTAGGGGETIIGSNCLFMAYAHVAHDCRVGDNVVLANAATLAGHVEVGDYAFFGGLCAIHQFARIGQNAMIAGGAMVAQDVAPYTMAHGNRADLVGLNLTGLKRRGFSREAIGAIKQAYRLVFRSGLKFEEAVPKVAEECADLPEVKTFMDFLLNSKRGFTRC